jgi:hypothetical protein
MVQREKIPATKGHQDVEANASLSLAVSFFVRRALRASSLYRQYILVLVRQGREQRTMAGVNVGAGAIGSGADARTSPPFAVPNSVSGSSGCAAAWLLISTGGEGRSPVLCPRRSAERSSLLAGDCGMGEDTTGAGELGKL